MEKIITCLPLRLLWLAGYLLLAAGSQAQYKQFKISPDGDTLNIIDKNGLKQGRWVVSVPELRGEPGHEEEGSYKNDKKEGPWRLYTTAGDLIGVENYRYGGKDGVQQYFSYLGQLEREEEWHSVNPDAPYDTIPIYGSDNNQILGYKIVRTEQYSVPNGKWTYYDPESGEPVRVEHYDRGHLVTKKEDDALTDNPASPPPAADTTSSKKSPAKTPEMLQYEKKYSKKKRAAMERDGQTGL